MSQQSQNILGITGHRPDKLGGWVWNQTHAKTISDLRRSLIYLRPSYLLTGMALGTDQWAAEVSIELGIPFIAAIPHDNQDFKWPPPAKAKYHQLLSSAFRIYVVSPGEYEPWKLVERNKWIVNNCQKLLAVWDGARDGGTSHCVEYAERNGKEIFRINPWEPLVIPGEAPLPQANQNPLLQSTYLGSRSPRQSNISQTAQQIIQNTRNSWPAASPTNQSNEPQQDGPSPYRRIIDI